MPSSLKPGFRSKSYSFPFLCGTWLQRMLEPIVSARETEEKDFLRTIFMYFQKTFHGAATNLVNRRISTTLACVFSVIVP
mmetsp:Transcript_18653/g.42955  ORF Transcript_18653/g.42955 Transcript_18653/m.42955 type:complete len:80 (-) Transcript_18653:736-975(-)